VNGTPEKEKLQLEIAMVDSMQNKINSNRNKLKSRTVTFAAEHQPAPKATTETKETEETKATGGPPITLPAPLSPTTASKVSTCRDNKVEAKLAVIDGPSASMTVEGPSTGAVAVTVAPPIFHVLMLPEGETCSKRRRIENNLQHDFLGKRYEAYKSMDEVNSSKAASSKASAVAEDASNKGKQQGYSHQPMWSGATGVEKRLISCCGVPQLASNDEGDFTLLGGLRRDRVLPFVRYLSRYCLDISSRGLALSILEQTIEADSPLVNNDQVATVTPTAGTAAAVAADTAPLTPPPKKPDRLRHFIGAGGLNILNQWLTEASTLESADAGDPKAPPAAPANKTHAKSPSPIDPLILPLLLLLRALPFDLNLVKESKINETIRDLSKKIDALVVNDAKGDAFSPKSTMPNEQPWDTTHPKADASTAHEVQEAINNLKHTWRKCHRKAVRTAASTNSTPKPFQAVQDVLTERLQELQAHEAKMEQERRPIGMEESAERNRKYLAELQEIREKEGPKKRRPEATLTFWRRQVWWQDKFISSQNRDRDELEQVFMFDTNIKPAAGLLPASTAHQLITRRAAGSDARLGKG
jgi:hypothetical protein